jgi:hypothetical protein
MVPRTPALTAKKFFIASMRQTSVSSSTSLPIVTNGFSPGFGEA